MKHKAAIAALEQRMTKIDEYLVYLCQRQAQGDEYENSTPISWLVGLAADEIHCLTTAKQYLEHAQEV